MLLVETLKTAAGYEGMFVVAFLGLLVALVSNYKLDDEKKVKFTDYYCND